MSEEIASLREELAGLRAELKELRLEQNKLLRMVGICPEDKDEKWPDYLHIEASCLAVRDHAMKIPIIMRTRDDGACIAFRDDNHRTRAELSIGKDGARFEMHNAEGKLIFQLAEAVDGSGQMCVCDAEGHPRAGLRVNEYGGVVNVVDQQAKPQVILLGTPEGGQIFTTNAMHQASATMKATNRGGMVCVHEPSGQLMGFLAADTETGSVGVYGPHGAMAAQVGAGPDGGGIVFHDLDGEMREKLP